MGIKLKSYKNEKLVNRISISFVCILIFLKCIWILKYIKSNGMWTNNDRTKTIVVLYINIP